MVRTLEGSFTGWWCHVLGDPGQKSMPSEPLFSYPETNANPMPMLCCSSSPLEGSNQVNVLESILCPLKSYCDLWIVGYHKQNKLYSEIKLLCQSATSGTTKVHSHILVSLLFSLPLVSWINSGKEAVCPSLSATIPTIFKQSLWAAHYHPGAFSWSLKWIFCPCHIDKIWSSEERGVYRATGKWKITTFAWSPSLCS